MIGINESEFYSFLYNNLGYLNYLRYHPKWYKILYYEHNYDAFIRVAKDELHDRLTDKLEGLKRNIALLKSLNSYFDKK
ncbi:MAG: hypothetical protein HP024_00980 [Acholeplasmatales bacterium]|nr:hypothetical protein [Acholeplasmatales bacterium]